MPEEWRAVQGWENFYQVSSWGRVKRVAPGKNTFVGKILKPGKTSKDGHCHVVLCSGKRLEQRTVHRMVAEAFLEPRDTDPHRTFVAHKDGDASHNHASNLYWATPSENTFDQVRHGTAIGRVSSLRKPVTEDVVRTIRQDPRPASQLAAILGLCAATITQIRRRETHSHVPPQPGDYVVKRPRRLFSPRQVVEIRRDLRSVADIARAYGVSANTIRAIRTKKYYGYVPD